MLNSPDRASGRVDALAALSLAGPDAVGFAQRICANEVAALAVGDWQWNCLLSPQGRVQALFRLWRRAEDELTLVLPACAREPTTELLGRYLLRAKLVLANDLGVLLAGRDYQVPPAGAVMRSSDGRWLAIVDAGHAQAAPFADVSDAWRARDLAQGIPWLEPGAVETFTPQALSLDRLEAFSVRKGCYPGQEIVARMHFLGQNKRELRRFAGDGSIATGAPLCAAGAAQRVLGVVVMQASGPQGFEVLAVVQRLAGDEPLFAGSACDVPLRVLPLEAPPLAATTAPLAKA